MALNTAYFALLFVSLAGMLVQLLVNKKNLEHIFFAIFCGSMAMVAAQQLSAESLGAYQYLIGLGTCATCNAMWLLSKAIFSGENAISKQHIIFALVISALIIMNNSLHMAYEFSFVTDSAYLITANSLGEIANLLSSTVLALTCWEALKGISKKTKQEFWQRILFISSFCIGIILCKIVANAFVQPDMLEEIFPWLIVISAIQIMLVTQVILWWKQRSARDQSSELVCKLQAVEDEVSDIDQSVVAGINALLKEDKKYLTPNLKMIDLANELNVSEYKISRTIRHHFGAPNFNHFINSLRIQHAKNLLEQADSKHWPILVIALESGFSSLATFNRVFKMQLGYAPNKHRTIDRMASINEI